MRDLQEYEKIVGKNIVDSIREKAKLLREFHIANVNSTYVGGGVAEILNSIIPLFNEIGIKMGWRVLHGSDDFFSVTKKIHNALQGAHASLTNEEKLLYEKTNKIYSTYTHLDDHDLVMVHDPQPLPMIKFYNKKQPWILRIHIDISQPNTDVWNYIKKFISKYDGMIVSSKNYIRQDIPIRQMIVYPAIDPLSPKNIDMTGNEVDSELTKFDIPVEKPIISQISRFDKWKDPMGVINIFEKVRKKVDCTLVLLGNFATDDPEGQKMFESVERRAMESQFRDDIRVVLVESEKLVNSLQRKSAVVIQNSVREGFGLVVAEALYKGTPVVASNVGGIRLQIKNGYNGFLIEHGNYDEFAQRVIYLLKNDNIRRQMGMNGMKFVRENFLITRLMNDWMDIFLRYLRS